MSLDQTGFKFKGDCLVDSVSAEQNTLGCRDTTCLVPLWELSRLMTSGATLPVRLWPRDVPPLVQTGQQCQLTTDLSPPQPARISASIGLWMRTLNTMACSFPGKLLTMHKKKSLLCPRPEHVLVIIFLCLCPADHLYELDSIVLMQPLECIEHNGFVLASSWSCYCAPLLATSHL